MDAKELKPCPFCGSEAQMTTGFGAFGGRVQIDCTNCRNATWWWEEAVAVRSWNARAALAHSDAVQAPIAWMLQEPGQSKRWYTSGEAAMQHWVSKGASATPLYAAPVAPAAAPSALASLVEFNPEHPLLANAEPPEEVWSADRETFDCDSLGELLDSNELEIGQTVYVGEKVPVDATSYIEVEILLDSLGDRAFDHVGEAADGYPDVSQEARDELEALLSAWVQKNAKPNFYRVKKIREYTITQQDIEDATQGAAQCVTKTSRTTSARR